MASKENNFDNMVFFHELKLAAYQTFFILEDLEGQAEVFFLWALLYIMNPSYGKQKRGSTSSPLASSQFDNSLLQRESSDSTTTSDLVTMMSNYFESDGVPPK